ncbi:MAG: 30S ribosomal protein S20 [Bacilli bacterium]|nr:30S ribosomal protein S20 [Bacilli bacterium]
MPNIKSAKKRVKTSATKNLINTYGKSSMKTAVKNAEKAVKNGSKEEIVANANIAIKRIDKALSSGLIHKNKAARQKSKISKMKNI